jgi:enoyl-[acyl-carrier-protein] reductase (NADH)
VQSSFVAVLFFSFSKLTSRRNTLCLTRLGNKEETYYKIPLCKWVEPEEIAETALYLSSPSAKSITGATIVMDNGALLVSDKRERYGF